MNDAAAPTRGFVFYTLLMRVYAYPDRSREPAAVSVVSCRVAYLSAQARRVNHFLRIVVCKNT